MQRIEKRHMEGKKAKKRKRKMVTSTKASTEKMDQKQLNEKNVWRKA